MAWQLATQIAWLGNADFAHIHDLLPWPDLPTRLKTAVAYQDVDTSECPTAVRIIGPPWATPQGVMMRKGESKSGTELVRGSHAQIDAWCRQRLLTLGSDFPYDQHYGSQVS